MHQGRIPVDLQITLLTAWWQLEMTMKRFPDTLLSISQRTRWYAISCARWCTMARACWYNILCNLLLLSAIMR